MAQQRIALLTAVILLGAAPARAFAACSDFAMNVDMASHAYVEYMAYRDGAPPSIADGVDADQVQADLTNTEYSTFSHFMDVAGEYAADCDETDAPRAWREYYRLEWRDDEHNYWGSAGDRDVQTGAAQSELDALKGLARLHYFDVDPSDYGQMKAATLSHYRHLRLVFTSPETGKIIR